MRDHLGLAFFTFAATVTMLAAWERPTILSWLAALHNILLAANYARRYPAQKDDRLGLGLGLLAALLPLAAPYPAAAPTLMVALGLLGYGLVLWSLLTLGRRFGIAPSDRGLVTGGPYRFVRHPMYCGELVLRSSLVVTSPRPLLASILLLTLLVIQVIRLLREERILAGYAHYASRVRYRLLPGVW